MKLEDLRHVIKVLRPIQFVGDGKVATISLPSAIKHIAKLRRGDKVEVIFDMRKPTEFKIVIHKEVADNAGQG